MAPPLSGPDPSLPLSSATRELRVGLDDATFEADFADLAARFAAQSGGGLSRELSAELALEIVLNEVVEQACLATGATGAAIVLQRDGEMVCRASSGATAPELGARLDATSGLSGECVRTRQTQRCDDVLADLRADLGASQRLGVRSVMVMPLLRGEELIGVFELFSSLPGAFGERDERTLEALAGRVLNNLSLNDRALDSPARGDREQVSHAAQPYAAPGGESFPPSWPAVPETLAFKEMKDESAPISSAPISEVAGRRGVDFTTAVLAAAVIVCTALLGLLLGRHVGAQQGALRAHSAAAVTQAVPNKAASNVDAAMSSVAPGVAPGAQTAAGATSPSGKTIRSEIPPGSLLVYENGKEVFRQDAVSSEGETSASTTKKSPPNPMTLAQRQSGGQGSDAAAGPAVSADSNLDANDVLRRVEPEYPADALQQKIEGPVVLDVRISPVGQVQAMTLVAGQPLLVQAAKDAVQQWRFKPHSVNGHPATMQARVTLNFRLPQ